MLKRDITYEDFDGNSVTETFYFNISKPELVELEVEKEGGLQNYLQKIIDTKDGKELIAQFKKIVLLAYGQRSDDGKRFIKNEQMKEEFSQTNAYNEIFMELATDDGKAAEFFLAVMPRDMVGQIQSKIEDVAAPVLNTPPEASPHSA